MSLDLLVNQLLDAIKEQLAQLTPLGKPLGKEEELLSPSEKRPLPKDVDQKSSNSTPSDKMLASKIDHTLLKADATREEIEQVCREARENHFATVCVNSGNVELAAKLLKDSRSKPIAVVGFPLGAAATPAKAFEAAEATRLGAQEIDMVINLGALKSRDYVWVFDDICQVVKASKPYPVKVILETSSLDQDQKIMGCVLAKAAGAAFVKTSTGFGNGGATVEDVALMRRIVGPEMGVKASGGIRTYEDAVRMIEAGASRIGASASVAIVTHEVSNNKKSSLY